MTKYTHKKKVTIAKTKAGPTMSPAQEEELSGLREDIRSLGRRTTAQAIELGGYLARVKAILPEKALGAWIKAVCKFTPKTGRNYIAVHANLSDYKERLEAAAVAPTILFVLAHAQQQDVERVIEAMETGEQLTVSQVKQMVGVATKKKVASSDEVLNLGGVAGLRRVAEMKIDQDVTLFDQLMSRVLKAVERALEPLASGRAVRKGALQDAVVYPCRHAHDLINAVAAPMKEGYGAGLNLRPSHLPKETAWGRVQALMWKMGSVESWPNRPDFVPWLQNDVLPLLRFVVHGEAMASAEEETAVVAERDEASTWDAIKADDRMQKGRDATLTHINSVLNGLIEPASSPASNPAVPSSVAA